MVIVNFPLPWTAFTRGYRRGLDAGVDLIDALDPGNECPHGRLPGDAGLTCDCWTAEVAALARRDALALRDVKAAA